MHASYNELVTKLYKGFREWWPEYICWQSGTACQ